MTNLKKVSTVAIVALLVLGLSACPKDGREKALIYMRDFQVALEAVQDAEITAHRLGYVSIGDHVSFQGTVVKLATYGKAANSALARGGSDVVTQLDLALKELDTLQKSGLLTIKNEQSRVAMSALLLTLRTIITSARVEAQ